MFGRLFRNKIYPPESTVNKDPGKYLDKVKRAFNIEGLLREQHSNATVADYYTQSSLGYRLFNDSQGFVHFGYSDKPYLRKDDFSQMLRFVESLISEKTTKILELSSGKGANSQYLLTKHPHINIHGIDLVQKPEHVSNKYSSRFTFTQDDFHKLNTVPNSSFDIAFVVESLCHSENKAAVLQKVYEKLKKGGWLIIIDGYRAKENANMPQTEQTITKLCAKGMAINDLETIYSFRETLGNSRFELVDEVNITQNIIPTAKKFEFLARGFFKLPHLTKLLMRLLPPRLCANSITGLFAWSMIERGNVVYMVHQLRKS